MAGQQYQQGPVHSQNQDERNLKDLKSRPTSVLGRTDSQPNEVPGLTHWCVECGEEGHLSAAKGQSAKFRMWEIQNKNYSVSPSSLTIDKLKMKVLEVRLSELNYNY